MDIFSISNLCSIYERTFSFYKKNIRYFQPPVECDITISLEFFQL